MKLFYLTLFFVFSFLPENLKSQDGYNLMINNQSCVAELVCIKPTMYDKAFSNPLKGFRGDKLGQEKYPTLKKDYIKWNEIETSASDGLEKIKQVCNKRWSGYPELNLKVIPRVYLEWPYKVQNESHTRDTVVSGWGDIRYVERFWPSDLEPGDYASDRFKQRLFRMIKNMGLAWDNDARVAYVEMGLIGFWGEQHSPSINPEMQKMMGDAFVEAFKNKKVMIRYAKDFTDYQFGEYWDSFAHIGEAKEVKRLEDLGRKWETTVRGGETSYGWGDFAIQPGENPDESLKNPQHRKWIIEKIRSLHFNHLGWINRYSQNNPEVAAGAEEVQKTLGYRFVIDSVFYTPNIKKGEKFNVRIFVKNVGSSPFYYSWPVEISLLHPETKAVVWKDIFKNADITTWMPGDKWNSTLTRYDEQPEENLLTGEFNLPENIKPGKYILAVSILDPAGKVPAVRFAIKNYFNGGRHPLGYIGVKNEVEEFLIPDPRFDDLENDRSLFYVNN